jgi:hypothetical protein
MQLFALTFAAFLLAFGLLSLGPILGRAPLRWGCGSLSGADCAGCRRPCERRRDRAGPS